MVYQSQIDRAQAFLLDELADGQRRSAELRPAATAEGLSWSTVKLAADRLGVIRTSFGWPRETAWELPSAETAPATASSAARRTELLASYTALTEATGAAIEELSAVAASSAADTAWIADARRLLDGLPPPRPARRRRRPSARPRPGEASGPDLS